eukprot:3495085-Pyramimonas_sp.AAC.1
MRTFLLFPELPDRLGPHAEYPHRCVAHRAAHPRCFIVFGPVPTNKSHSGARCFRGGPCQWYSSEQRPLLMPTSVEFTAITKGACDNALRSGDRASIRAIISFTFGIKTRQPLVAQPAPRSLSDA